MSTGKLKIDLAALVANWRALDAQTGPTVETAAVVKANGYGCGAGRVARALAQAGARRFFVATAEEGVEIRQALGPGPEVCIFSGHMAGDTDMIHDLVLTPMLNSLAQLTRHFEALPGAPFGIQLDTGMNRLGMEVAEWAAVRDIALSQNPTLVMSHLACADEPDHSANEAQLQNFRAMTEGITAPRSLSATGGILLPKEYHFNLTRPGIGLYGGAPFEAAKPVVSLSLPVIQTRELEEGEAVGYGCTWVAEAPSKLATVSGGYADGLIRAMSNNTVLWFGDTPCPLVGRVSMDLITVDITHLTERPDALDILCPAQTVDDLATAAGTIGYEILTSLGSRYTRRYVEAGS
ncbi:MULTISPECIES: alanine racemase [Halocynthiibacter]|uniref:Alanine racemase n=1 Tax=Halocynthiibacter halioticoli TaxID=2986804 RepID=A0AAE3LT79_9RHOB|nr:MULTISPECIES: alanine racemase [Halocynthiibacter]MCV6824666.1 alanine racemase [Halocynthiibacter halioticoli]MCW4057667.1 alanine racemase [Halocynthiibacter sp. SDUM655004]MDE0589295.1 alanine racemase [Halocynthiibacter sp. C4]